MVKLCCNCIKNQDAKSIRLVPFIHSAYNAHIVYTTLIFSTVKVVVAEYICSCKFLQFHLV